jgi:hypothetical protein
MWIHARMLKHRLFLVLLSLSVVGCGDGKPPKYELSGTVTFDGKRVPEGSIMFRPSDNRSAPETTQIVDGKYSLQLPAGQKSVMIEASRFVGPVDKTMGQRPRDQYIPFKYNVESKLTMEVKAENGGVHDFTLTK